MKLTAQKLKLVAQFCAAAYKENISKVKLAANAISSDWKLVATSDETKGANDFSYRSFAMVNEFSHQVLVVNSGTRIKQKHHAKSKEFLNDLFADLEILSKNVPTQFTEDGEVFLNSLLKDFKDYKFITAGHSLGGVFAQLSHTYLATKGVLVSSHVIEAPGAFEIIQKYVAKNYHDINVTAIAEQSHVYNADPNMINSIHKQFGHVYRIPTDDTKTNVVGGIANILGIKALFEDAPEDYKKIATIFAKADAVLNTINGHDLKYIVENLQSDDQIIEVAETAEQANLTQDIFDLFGHLI